jgi:chemotaxis regulatin CheY-phosphate phosphatase CheZ
MLSALPTEVCRNINDSLEEINENAADAYEQLKALLVSQVHQGLLGQSL